MQSIKIRNGYTLKILGAPKNELFRLESCSKVAVTPEWIPFVKPRVKVRTGDQVSLGTVLFEDRRQPEIKFLSPGGGMVAAINYGPRRVIKEIVVALDPDEKQIDFGCMDEKDLKSMDRKELVAYLAKAGVWPYLKSLPYGDIAPLDQVPPEIIVSLKTQQPYTARPEVYLAGQKDLFLKGLKILEKLVGSAKKVLVVADMESTQKLANYASIITYRIEGVYPSDDPGVFNFYFKKSPKQNKNWYIDGQDLLQISRLCQTGIYPIQRIVAVGGSKAIKGCHKACRLGLPVTDLIGEYESLTNVRLVLGGVFRGYEVSMISYLGFYETSLQILPDGKFKEFGALFNPGLKKSSFSKTFLSTLNPTPLELNCNLHGGIRACISCGHCSKVCPVNIFPQLTYKAILAEAVDEYLAHGLLDCVECGLCSYVCPAKIELTAALKDAKAAYYKEQLSS
jgi:Na+-transporting NADH:ubiquinone oxidoreductase subunit A